jgi:hypothetical protein
MRLSFFLVVLFAISAIAQPSQQRLFGLWHTVSITAHDGRDITPRGGGGIEREFRSDGTLVETVLAPAQLGNRPLRYRAHYKFLQPDRIICTYFHGGQEYTREQRFHMNGDVATFENFGSGMITKMRRIPKSEFNKPKDVAEMP